MSTKKLWGGSQSNHLSPMIAPWAFEMYNAARQNTWHEQEVDMGSERECFYNALSRTEQTMFKEVFSFLTTSDIVIGRNIAANILQHITAPEVQIFLARQIDEEALHSVTYQHMIEVLGLDEDEIYTMYQRVPEIKAIFDLGEKYACLFDQKGLEYFILGLIYFYLVWEGVLFYHGFTPPFSLQRRNLMKASCTQLQLIGRDEVNHFTFGTRLIKEICKEQKFSLKSIEIDIQKMFVEAHNVKLDYARRVIPNILGYNAETDMRHTRYLMNLRLNSIGLNQLFDDAGNVVPWLNEQFHIKKEKNFFEMRVTEYRVGGLNWGDD